MQPSPASAALAPTMPRAGSADLFLLRVDDQGRLRLQGPVADLGWLPRCRLALCVLGGGVLRLQRIGDLGASGGGTATVEVCLDRQYRLQLPYGIRTVAGLLPGVKVIVATNPVDDELAVMPVPRLVSALSGQR